MSTISQLGSARDSSSGEIVFGVRCKSAILLMTIAFEIAALLGLCLFAVTGVAYAQEVFSEGPLYYVVEDGSVTITGYFGRDAKVEVPASIAGMPVNTVAAGAFAGTAARTVVLPDCVTTMESGAVSQGTEVFWAGGSSGATPTSGATGDGGASAGGASGGGIASLSNSDGAAAGGSSSYVVGEFEADADLDKDASAGTAGSQKAAGKEGAGLFGGSGVVGAGSGSGAILAGAAVVIVALVVGIVLVARRLRKNRVRLS